MQWIAAAGAGAFVLASLVVGGRLILLSRTTRKMPEFLLGAGLFAMGGLGYPMLQIGIQATGLSDSIRVGFILAHAVLGLLGMTAIAYFTQQVFRPGSGAARTLVVGIFLGFLGLFAAQAVMTGFLPLIDDQSAGVWHHYQWLNIVCMTWAGVESLRYFSMMKRRVGLDLADPIVADRFRLWAIGILCADLLSVIATTLTALGVDMATSTAGLMLVGSLGCVTAGTLWIAFFPPAGYLRRRRAATAE